MSNMFAIFVVIFIILVLLSAPFIFSLFARTATYPGLSAEEHMRRQYNIVKWRRTRASASFLLSAIVGVSSGLIGAGQLAQTAYDLGSVSSGSRILFYIPRTSASIMNLDQAVAIAGGMITMGFSIYEAVECILAQEREGFERWRISYLRQRRLVADVSPAVVELELRHMPVAWHRFENHSLTLLLETLPFIERPLTAPENTRVKLNKTKEILSRPSSNGVHQTSLLKFRSNASPKSRTGDLVAGVVVGGVDIVSKARLITAVEILGCLSSVGILGASPANSDADALRIELGTIIVVGSL